MVYKKIFLKDIDDRVKRDDVFLRIYLSKENESVSKRPGMLICPGGGYFFCSEREAEPIAFRFLSEGFHCFVLNYSTKSSFPLPHIDLAVAFLYIQTHAEEFGLLPNSLSLIGFSAGGHLCASYGYAYKDLSKVLLVEEKRLRPLSLVLCYPVIDLNTPSHAPMVEMMSGGKREMKEYLDVTPHVKDDYPPTFLWTTKDDAIVPYVHALHMQEALVKAGVREKTIIFESGYHGASLANRSCYPLGGMGEGMGELRDWASLAADFIFEELDKHQ